MEVPERPKPIRMIKTRKPITPDPISLPAFAAADAWCEFPLRCEFPPKLTPQQHPYKPQPAKHTSSRFDQSLSRFLSRVDRKQPVRPCELPPALSFESNPLTDEEIKANCIAASDRPYHRFFPDEPLSPPLEREAVAPKKPARRGTLALPMKVKLPPIVTPAAIPISLPIAQVSGLKHMRSVEEPLDCSIIANTDSNPVRALSDFAVPHAPFKRQRSSRSINSSSPEDMSSSNSPDLVPIVGASSVSAVPAPIQFASELKVPFAYHLPLSFPQSYAHPEHIVVNPLSSSFSPPLDSAVSLSPPLDPHCLHPETSASFAARSNGYNMNYHWTPPQAVVAPAYAVPTF